MPTSLTSHVTSSMHCCSVETVPDSIGGDGGLFALGMYELNEETSLRNGAIALYDRDALIATHIMASGVLDMKFHGNVLACAMSSGNVELLNIDVMSQSVAAQGGGICNPEEGLALSVDWSRGEGEDVLLAVSTQEGSVFVYDLLPTGLEIRSSLQNVHSLFGERIPAWITAFNPHNPMVLVSGGDDCCLKLWDLRCPESPVHNMAKFFTAGVTSAQWCPYRSQPHLYAVGSYDGSIALWDERMQRREPHSSVDSGGGVWRLKWRPESEPAMSDDDGALYLGAASMHNGSGIHRVDPSSCASSSEGGAAVAITTVDTQQDVNEARLVYGMDWLKKRSTKTKKGETVLGCGAGDSGRSASEAVERQLEFEIATCSFYDNLVQIWSS